MRMTLWGFNQYDPNLFADIDVPESCDSKILVDTIMMESGDLYPYYQHPGYLKRNIDNWFYRMKPNFNRMFNALEAEYNPIHNYDRYEEYEDKEVTSGTNNYSSTDTGSATHSATDTDSKTYGSTGTDNIEYGKSTTDNSQATASGTETKTLDTEVESSGSQNNSTSSTSTSTGNREDKVSAYNAVTYQPSANTDSSNSATDSSNGTSSSTNTTANTGTEEIETSSNTHDNRLISESGNDLTTNTLSGTENLEMSRSSEDSNTLNRTGSDSTNGTKDNEHTAHLYGNIGVTKSQEMISDELELRKIDIYIEIARMFEKRFIVQVY